MKTRLATFFLSAAALASLASAQNIDTLPEITGSGIDKDNDYFMVRDATASNPALRKMDIGEIVNVPSLFSSVPDGTFTIAKTTGLQAALDGKQATLVSATNIKTINGSSVLGSGDLTVGGGVDSNAEVNALLDENPNASLHSIGAARQGFPAFLKASTLNSATRNGVGNAKRLDTMGFGDSIYANAGQYLRATLGYGGSVRPIISADNATLSGNAKAMGTSRTWTVNATTDVITSSNHGFLTGDQITVSNSGGSLPTSSPQITNTQYYVIWQDKDTFKIATSRVNAFAGTAIDFTGTGTGTHSAIVTTGAHYYKSPNGLFASIGDGTITVYPPPNDNGGSTSAMNGREVIVWYWSQTGGGTWSLQYDSNTSGSYATLHATSPSTTTITTNGTVNTATGVVDATDGGANGALKWVKYVLPNYYNLRLRFNGSGSTGAGQVCAVGVLEVPYSVNSRIPGVTDFTLAYAGTTPSQWNEITDASLNALLTAHNPDVIFVRGYETLSDMQDYFCAPTTGLAARIRAIKPGVQFVIIGMHPTLDNQHHTLDETDLYLQDWCDANNGTYVPVRNQMGRIQELLDARFYGTTAAVNLSSASGDTITTATDHGLTPGKWVVFSGLTGTNTLTSDKWFEPYQVLATPTANTLTLENFAGTAPVSVGGTITGGTMAGIDGTHPSEDGKTAIDSIIAESMKNLGIVRETMRGNTAKGLDPSRIQTAYADMRWIYARPSNKLGAIAFARTDGGSTSVGYYTALEVGVNANDFGYLAGTNGAGLSLTQNPSALGILGYATNNATNWVNGRFTATVNGRNDMLEITSAGVATWIPLSLSSAAGAGLNMPTQAWRHGATNTSKGTEYAVMTKDSGLIFSEGLQGIVLKNTTHGRIGTGVTLTSGVATVANATVTANTHVSITKTAHGAGVSGTGYVVTKLAAAADHVIYGTVTAGVDDNFTLASHGFETGMAVSLSNSGGALPAATPALATSTLYYVVKTAAGTFKLATSAANALAATPTVIDITGTGSGTHSVRTAAFVITSTDTSGATVTTDVGTFDWMLTERN